MAHAFVIVLLGAMLHGVTQQIDICSSKRRIKRLHQNLKNSTYKKPSYFRIAKDPFFDLFFTNLVNSTTMLYAIGGNQGHMRRGSPLQIFDKNVLEEWCKMNYPNWPVIFYGDADITLPLLPLTNLTQKVNEANVILKSYDDGIG